MKRFLPLMFIFIVPASANSQIISGFGIKVGPGFSNQSWIYSVDIDLDFDNRSTVSPRIFLEFFDLSFLEMQTELGYFQKGFKEEVPVSSLLFPDGTGEYVEVNNKLNYLSLSALAKLKYPLEFITPYFIVGPQFNYLLSKDIDGGWEVVFDEFSNTNFGISLGVGADMSNALPVTLLVEYRFERDFADNFDSSTLNIINYSHVFLLGIKL